MASPSTSFSILAVLFIAVRALAGDYSRRNRSGTACAVRLQHCSSLLAENQIVPRPERDGRKVGQRRHEQRRNRTAHAVPERLPPAVVAGKRAHRDEKDREDRKTSTGLPWVENVPFSAIITAGSGRQTRNANAANAKERRSADANARTDDQWRTKNGTCVRRPVSLIRLTSSAVVTNIYIPANPSLRTERPDRLTLRRLSPRRPPSVGDAVDLSRWIALARH